MMAVAVIILRRICSTAQTVIAAVFGGPVRCHIGPG